MSQEIVLKGRVKKINPLESFDSGFEKQTIVITELEGNYPQDLPIDFVKDKIAKLDSIKIDDVVEVKINFRGSEYNGKNYLSLQGWFLKIEIQEPESLI